MERRKIGWTTSCMKILCLSSLEVDILDWKCKDEPEEATKAYQHYRTDAQAIMMVAKILLNVVFHWNCAKAWCNHSCGYVTQLGWSQSIYGPLHWIDAVVPAPPYWHFLKSQTIQIKGLARNPQSISHRRHHGGNWNVGHTSNELLCFWQKYSNLPCLSQTASWVRELIIVITL